MIISAWNYTRSEIYCNSISHVLCTLCSVTMPQSAFVFGYSRFVWSSVSFLLCFGKQQLWLRTTKFSIVVVPSLEMETIWCHSRCSFCFLCYKVAKQGKIICNIRKILMEHCQCILLLEFRFTKNKFAKLEIFYVLAIQTFLFLLAIPLQFACYGSEFTRATALNLHELQLWIYMSYHEVRKKAHMIGNTSRDVLYTIKNCS